jgi:hypothetical protein
MHSDIKVVKGFMSDEDLAIVQKYLVKNDSVFTDFGNGEKEFTFHANFADDSVKSLLDSYGKKVLKFVQKNYEGTFGDFDPSKTHVARFGEGWGMHEHFDSTKPNDIATLIYLNNTYMGGEIYFPDHDIEIKPEPGDLVCFPDTPEFVHGVKPISGGIRYTAPRWFTRIV